MTHRYLAARGLVALVVTASLSGCASTAAPPDAIDLAVQGTTPGATQGDHEREVFTGCLTSRDPKATGVTYWSVSLAHTNDNGFFWIATGFDGGSKAVLELVIADHERYIRSPDASPMNLTPEVLKAVGTDLRFIGDQLQAKQSVSPPSTKPPGLICPQGTLNSTTKSCESGTSRSYAATATVTGGIVFDKPIYAANTGFLDYASKDSGPGMTVYGYTARAAFSGSTPIYYYPGFSTLLFNPANATLDSYVSSTDLGGMKKIYYSSTSAKLLVTNPNYTLNGYVAPLAGTYGGTSLYTCPSGGTLSGTTCNLDALAQTSPTCPVDELATDGRTLNACVSKAAGNAFGAVGALLAGATVPIVCPIAPLSDVGQALGGQNACPTAPGWVVDIDKAAWNAMKDLPPVCVGIPGQGS